MKNVLRVVLVSVLLISTSVWAADKFAVATGAWNVTTTWSLTRGGASGAPVPAQGDSVIIPSPFTVTVEASGKVCKSLTIESGGTVLTGVVLPSNTIRYIRVYNGIVTTDGTLGTVGGDGIAFECSGTVTFAGSGTIRPSRIRPRTDSTNVNIIIDCDMTPMYTGSTGGGGMAIYTANSAGNNNITVTVNSGRTLTLPDLAYFGTASSVTVDGTASSIFNINGSFVQQGTAASTNLRVSAGKTCQLNIGAAGSMSISRNLNASLGAGTTSIVSNGLLSVGAGGAGTADFTTPSVTVTGTGTFTLPSGASINIGAATGLDPASGSIQTTTRSFSTGANYSYVGTAAQVTGSDLPSTVNNLTINNATGVTLTNSLTVDGTLNMTSGSLSLNSNTLTYGGSSTLNYNNTTSQTTGEELLASLNNLTINNAAGVSLSSPTTVNGTLTLTTGLLTLGANNLTINAFSGTPSATAMVVATGSGELRKVFSAAGAFTFPVGDNTGTAEYSPATVTVNSADAFSSAYVSAKLVNAVHPNNTSGTNFLSRYWTLGASGITNPNYTATFKYVDLDINGTETSIYCGKYDGSWSLFAPTDDATNTLTASGITSFSDFSGGEIGIMPVELTSFVAVQKGRGIELAWKTATEVNNMGFEIEKNVSGSWSKIGFIEGAGTTNAPKNYSFIDASAKGSVSYRLKQIDRDGKFTYSQSVEAKVVLTAEDFKLSQNYPNPFNPNTTITFAMKNAEHVNVTVFNSLGQAVATLFNGIANPNELYSLNFDGKNLASGTYFYSLRSASRNEVKKMSMMK